MTDASYYPKPEASLILIHKGIEPGQTVRISSRDISEQFTEGTFQPQHFIFVGSKDLWILGQGQSYIGNTEREDGTGEGMWLQRGDIPCDSFRPPAPTFINWGVFDCISNHLVLRVNNRGKDMADFVARLAGCYAQRYPCQPYPYPPSPIRPG